MVACTCAECHENHHIYAYPHVSHVWVRCEHRLAACIDADTTPLGDVCPHCWTPMAAPSFLGADAAAAAREASSGDDSSVVRRACGHAVHWQCHVAQLEFALRSATTADGAAAAACSLCRDGRLGVLTHTAHDVTAWPRLGEMLRSMREFVPIGHYARNALRWAALQIDCLLDTDAATRFDSQMGDAVAVVTVAVLYASAERAALPTGGAAAMAERLRDGALRSIKAADDGYKSFAMETLAARAAHGLVAIAWRDGDTPPPPPTWALEPPLERGGWPRAAPRLASSASWWRPIAPHALADDEEGRPVLVWLLAPEHAAEFKFVYARGAADVPTRGWAASSAYATAGPWGNNVWHARALSALRYSTGVAVTVAAQP